tara:strand:+ start:17342 stop:17464 length:123 start_codon:yes stop_codon:yes gene_type:complete
LKILTQYEEMPGFVKRHKRISAKNINSVEPFVSEELALAA